MEPNSSSRIQPVGKSFTLLPHVIKQNAQEKPSAVFARTPAGTNYTDGYKSITNLQFAKAIDYTAALIEKSLGKGQNFETVAYIGPGDFRYSIIVVAGVKAGYKIFLPSPRNSKDAHLSLLDKLQCSKLIATEPQAPCIPMILGAMQMKTMTMPSLQSLLELDDVDEYPFECSFEEAKLQPFFVLHTSGSTGIPKPLIFNHEFVSRIIVTSKLPPPDGYVDINQYVARDKFFMTLPSFHIAGLAYSLFIACHHDNIPVYPLPGPPPNVESFISAISNTEVDWAFVPPVFIDEMAKDSDLLEKVASRLKYLFFTGGSVPKASGDVVAQRIPIWQVLGSSECGSLPLLHADTEYKNSEEWRYIQLSPLLKSDMRHRVDDLHELVMIRNSETDFQPVFALFPEMIEYETRDLFREHPTKKGLWAYQCRTDDVIVFSNGEKTNPVSFENEIISHPEVKSALVIGAQRFEAALLIELTNDTQLSENEKTEVIERIWPLVDSANQVAPAHARVSKAKILLVDPNIPMLRAGKGTVQRNATLSLYAEMIDKLYQQDESWKGDISAALSNKDDIKSLIRDLVADMMGWDDLDFFQHLGMDSLAVLRLQRSLKTRLPGKSISLNAVYSNPSVRALAKEIGEVAITGDTADLKDPVEELARVLKEYFKKIDSITPTMSRKPAVENDVPTTVLLTGSTGALGSYLLHRLLSLPSVTHIYCLNRTSDAKDRQIKNNQVRHLTTEFPPDRVTFLTGDLTKPGFGVSESNFQDLLSNITHTIHNAWPVNFNHSLSTFEPSLSGVLSLIQFSNLTKHRSSIQFLSSVSSVSSYPGSSVPESVIPKLSTPAAMGYGQSKYIAERMLDHACKKLGIRASSVRIGQVAGAARTAGGWNRQEWLPSLVVSSAFIGALPETLGDATREGDMVDWIPIDQLADVLVQLGLEQESVQEEIDGVSVFHVTHPKPVPWSSLLIPIKSTLETSSGMAESIKIVPYADWLSRLKVKSTKADQKANVDHEELARKNPAMKLLDFYNSLQDQGDAQLSKKLAMDKTLQLSETLRELQSIDNEWVSGWVKEWRSG